MPHQQFLLAGAALLFLPVLRWSILALLARFLAFVSFAVALSMAFAYVTAIKRGKRQRYRPPGPLLFTTPATWSAAQVKYAWEKKRVPFEPLHGQMSPEVSKAVDNLFELLMSAFVSKWYDEMTGPGASQAFPSAVERLVRYCTSRIIERAEKVDWASFLINTLVPRITRHLAQFRQAELKVRSIGTTSQADEVDLLLANIYAGSNVRLHPAVDVASYNTGPSEEAHLRVLVEKLLNVLLPETEKRSKAVLIMAREITGSTIALSIIDKLADPDFLNRLIEEKAGAAVREEKMVKELREALDAAPPTRSRSVRTKHASGPVITAASSSSEFERFLRSIKHCANIGEARRLRSDIDVSIRRTELQLVAAANAPSGQDELQKTTEQTVYLERLLLARDRLANRLQDLGDTASLVERRPLTQSSISLLDILHQPEALPLFMEFVERRRSLPLLEFYLTVDGLRNPLDSQSDVVENSISVREDIQMLWTTYLEQDLLQMNKSDIDLLHQAIHSDSNLEAQTITKIRQCIAALQKQALVELQDAHFADFQRSALYIKASAAVTGRQERASPARRMHPALMQRATSSPGREITTVFAPTAAPKPVTRTETAPLQVTHQLLSDLDPERSMEKKTGGLSAKPSLDFLMGSPVLDEGRPPLFDDHGQDENDGLATDYVQIDTVEAIQEALNTILESDRSGADANNGNGRTSRGSSRERRILSAIGPVGRKVSDNSLRSTSPSSVRPVTVSNPLPRRRIFDDEESEENTGYKIDNERARKEDNWLPPVSDSGLLVPGRFISEEELTREVSKLSTRHEALEGQEEVVEALIRKAELTGNIRELKLLNQSLSAVRRELRAIKFQRQQIADDTIGHQLVPGLVRIDIRGTTVSEGKGKPFVLYLVEVHQLDSSGLPNRGWLVTRRYSEFDSLDRALQAARIKTPELPSKRLVATLSANSVEARRLGLERYLRTLVASSAACSSLELRDFLSQSNIALPSLKDDIAQRAGGAALAQGFVRSMLRTVTTGIDGALSGPSLVDVIIQRLNQQAARDSVQEEDLATSGTLTANALHETHSSDLNATAPFATPLCDLFVELFGLEVASNWLRRQAVLIVMQQILGGTIEKRCREGVRAALAPANFLVAIDLLRSQISIVSLAQSNSFRTTEAKAASRDGAARALAALMPAMAANLIGRSNSRRAAHSVFAVMQNARLNRHFIYTVLDDVIRVLFKELS